jgi:hypothetical protein
VRKWNFASNVVQHTANLTNTSYPNSLHINITSPPPPWHRVTSRPQRHLELYLPTGCDRKTLHHLPPEPRLRRLFARVVCCDRALWQRLLDSKARQDHRSPLTQNFAWLLHA